MNETIRVSDTYVIFHNILTRITQFGDGNSNIVTDRNITEILSTERNGMKQSVTEILHTISRKNSNRDDSIQAEVDRLLFRDSDVHRPRELIRVYKPIW